MNVSPYVEHYSRLTSANEIKILLPIIKRLRQPDEQIEISIRELEEITGLSRSTISRGLCSMTEQDILIKTQKCPECLTECQVQATRCWKCNASIDNRALLYRVSRWPDTIESFETTEETLTRVLQAQSALLVGIRAEAREQHEALMRLNDILSDVKDEIRYLRRDLYDASSMISNTVENLGDTITQASLSVQKSAHQGYEKSVLEDDLDALAAEFEAYLMAELVEVEPEPTEPPQMMIWDSTAGMGCPEADAVIDLNAAIEEARETGCVTKLYKSGLEVRISAPRARAKLGHKCVKASQSGEELSYLLTYFRSFVLSKYSLKDARRLGGVPPSLKNESAKGRTFETQFDEERGETMTPTPQFRSTPSPKAHSVKLTSVLEHWMRTVVDPTSEKNHYLTAAQNLLNSLEAQEKTWNAYLKDAEAGFFEGPKPKAPNSVWTKATFAADLIRKLYPGANVNMQLVIQQIKRRGFIRYVDEQLSFYKPDMKCKPEMVPHTFGQKFNLENYHD